VRCVANPEPRSAESASPWCTAPKVARSKTGGFTRSSVLSIPFRQGLPQLPVDRYVRAVLLPEHGTAPQAVYVPYERSFDEDDGCTYDIPKYGQFLGDAATGRIRSDHLPQRPFAHLPHALHLMFRDAFMKDGSKQNACIAHLMGNEFPSSMWRGPVLVMKSGGEADPVFADMRMQDTRDIVGFIRQYGLAALSGS